MGSWPRKGLVSPMGFFAYNDMISMGGWIHLYRKILDNPIAKRPNYAWLWIVILLEANHVDKNFIWKGEKRTCKMGQFYTSRDALSKKSGVRPGTI